MISLPIIRAIAFPWVLIDKDDTIVDSGNGSLFSQPEATIEGLQTVLAKIEAGGWATCPAGFAIYKFTTESISPYAVVLYGMKVNGISTAQGRSSGLSVRMDPESLVQYVTEYCSGVEALDDGYRRLIRENIHEIRGINSALYNTAYELDTLLQNISAQPSTAKIAQSVVRWSELLSGRIDFMEFIANPSAVNAPKVEIAVYKKFDKIQRCFRVTASRNDIKLNIGGSSTSTVFGPPIFDIVPYLLLDNAVKYSPPNQIVDILCNESNQRIYCRVSSIGPRINDNELRTIFEPAVRGVNAVKSGKGGSGLGLPILQRVVKAVFGGDISVTQSATKLWLNAIPYTEVSFEIRLPIYSRPSQRH